MSGSIIPPSYFYLLSVCDNLSLFCLGALILSLFCLLGMGIAWCILAESWGDAPERNCKRLLRMMKCVIFLIPFFAVGAIFIPSKTTMLSIMVAKFVTYENAQLTVDAIKEAVDYIVQTIAQLK